MADREALQAAIDERNVERDPPRAVFDPVTIRQMRRTAAPGRFRASTPVPPAWKHLPGVLGGEEGPSVAAYGDTQDAALDELMRVIGRLCVLNFGGTAL